MFLKVQKINKSLLVLGIFVFFILLFSGHFLNNKQTSANELTAEQVYSVDNFKEFEKAVLEVCSDDENVLEEDNLLEIDAQNEINIGSKNTSESQDNESKFESKRLIVCGEFEEDYGAQVIIEGYKDYTVLCYPSWQVADYAYSQLIKDQDITVMIDSSICAASQLDVEVESIKDQATDKNWGYDAISADVINQYMQAYGSDEELVVAVLDSGVNTSHSFFDNRFLIENGKIVGDSYYTSTATGKQYNFEDDYGHGSHVSGIITQLTPDNVKILPMKVLNSSGKGSFLNCLLAIEKIIEVYSKEYNICCVNLSLGGASNDYDTISDFNNFFKTLYDNGILSVIAAGNDQLDTKDYVPASCDYAITVSALKNDENTYIFDHEYSNFGAEIDISAPGTSIYSAYIEGNNAVISGTSMAAPHVSAAIALLCLDQQYWNGSKANFSAKTIEARLLDNVVDLGESGWDKFYGWGMVDFRYFNLESKNNDVLSFYDGQNQLNDSDYIEFTEDFDLTVRSSDSTYDIYYTIDGSTPDLNSNLYTAPIAINISVIFKFIAFKVENGTVVSNSPLYTVDLFNANDSIDDFFVNENGVLIEYTGHFEKLEIPQVVDGLNVESLGIRLFYDNEIEYLSLPNSCTKIEEYCFSDCFNLKEISLDSVTEIDAFAFENCYALTEITLTNTTILAKEIPNEKLNGHVFENCDNLEIVYMPKIVTMGQNNFTNSAIKEIAIGTDFDNADGRTIDSNITIYGYQSSSAQQYARIYGNKFIAIDSFALLTDLESYVEVKQNEALYLQVKASGFNLSYQWQRTNGTVEDGQVIQTGISNLLVVDTSQVEKTSYYVMITNWDGQTLFSQICTVRVGAAPLFTIKYIIDQDNFITQDYYEGQEIELIETPTKEGYDFAGWYLDDNYQEEFILGTAPKEDIIVYAKWEIKKFNINIVSSGGGSVSPEEKIEVSYGDSQTLYFNPLTGYEIGEIIVDGEAVSEEMLDNISKNGLSLTNIKSSHEIYVEFIKRSYTITYVLDDFALDNIKQEYQYGDKITPPQTPVAQSYMYFVGWFEDENYESLAKFGNMPATDLVVYGQFKLKEYFITLSYEGGGEISPLNQTIIHPQTAVFNIELYDGYSIVDVKVDEISVSEEKLFEINNNGSFIFSILEYGYNSYDNSSFEEHTIYIKLEAKDYEIVFNLNYENGGEIVENFKREEKISFPELPVRQGYSFKGWYTDKACTSEFNLSEMPAKDLEIYAKWEINTYKITLSIFGNGNFYSDQDLSNIKYGENVQLKTNTNLYNYDMEVYVDEQLVETTKGTLLIENVTSDMNIVVRFTKKPFLKSLDGLITIISCLVIAFVIAIVVMTKIIKKRNIYKDMNNY